LRSSSGSVSMRLHLELGSIQVDDRGFTIMMSCDRAQ
jgi:hypothetical protein